MAFASVQWVESAADIGQLSSEFPPSLSLRPLLVNKINILTNKSYPFLRFPSS